MTERDENGRFVRGNKASPGRPPRATEREYLDVLIGAVTLDYWSGIVRRAIADALKGDKFAREWISGYIIGKPPTIIELKAAEAAQLRALLDSFKQRGVSASDVFGALLAQIAAEGEVDT